MFDKFHDGERFMQKQSGEEMIAVANGRIIKKQISQAPKLFIEERPYAILSSKDDQDQIWVSLIVGMNGIFTVPEPMILSMNTNRLLSSKSDILYTNLKKDAEVGGLFVDLSTRRRFRVNGSVRNTGAEGYDIGVKEAYPNCPKYIQTRSLSILPTSVPPILRNIEEGPMPLNLQELITKADTFFVGSGNQSGQLDASYRGGNPGFVEMLDTSYLKIPDYVGNSMYNTLGNIHANPKAGLLFVDFEKNATLQLTGQAQISFANRSEQDLEKTTGTGRYWLFQIERWIYTPQHHKATWELNAFSPFNP